MKKLIQLSLVVLICVAAVSCAKKAADKGNAKKAADKTEEAK